jgi:hypothetical protein
LARLRALATRLGDVAAGVAYAGLAAVAVRLLGDPVDDAGLAGATWGARLLALPGGRALLAVGGLVVLGAAVSLAARAVTGRVADRLERRGLRPATVRAIVALARAGQAARAGLFGVVGWLLVRAAWLRDAAGVGGLGSALDVLDETAVGPVVVGVASAGCLAYGAYQLLKARFRRLSFGAARGAAASEAGGGSPAIRWSAPRGAPAAGGRRALSRFRPPS